LSNAAFEYVPGVAGKERVHSRQCGVEIGYGDAGVVEIATGQGGQPVVFREAPRGGGEKV
jgi:hypothetical protein